MKRNNVNIIKYKVLFPRVYNGYPV